ncbi:MAG TPA: SAM-dependent methyltransferase [Thermoanaerobaculia bacterium]|nr:SAM-dependent methyltransferase [Thermoanaerobaculia bacterium]
MSDLESSSYSPGGPPVPAGSLVLNRLKNKELPFRDFVELALYDPVAGYYSRPGNPVGKAGDFITAPRISPVFGYALSSLAGDFVDRAGDGLCAIVDIGCGDGELIHTLCRNLHPSAASRAAFYGVDRSLQRVPPSLKAGGEIHFLHSIDELPGGLPMLILSNELFDAFPSARLVQREEGLHELWVREDGGALEWSEKPARAAYVSYFAEREIALETGQFADVSLEWSDVYRSLCERMERGLIVTIDYGFPQKQLFDVRIRRYGTAAAFTGHQVHRDLLARPGEQDLTAHINFSDLLNAGERAGLKTLLFERQAKFLLALGITDHPLFAPVADEPTGSLADALDREAERQAARRLILPEGIGEEMRVLVQGRGIAEGGWSFQRKLF